MPSGWSWSWFGAWTVAGVLVTFSLLAAASIGLLTLPFAVLGVWAITRGSPRWPTAFGLVSGAGLVCLLIWWINRGNTPCPASGALSGVPGEASVECGGVDPQPWLVAAVALIVVGAFAFAVARRRNRRSALG
jgi:hypothetical protein